MGGGSLNYGVLMNGDLMKGVKSQAGAAGRGLVHSTSHITGRARASN